MERERTLRHGRGRDPAALDLAGPRRRRRGPPVAAAATASAAPATSGASSRRTWPGAAGSSTGTTAATAERAPRRPGAGLGGPLRRRPPRGARRRRGAGGGAGGPLLRRPGGAGGLTAARRSGWPAWCWSAARPGHLLDDLPRRARSPRPPSPTGSAAVEAYPGGGPLPGPRPSSRREADGPARHGLRGERPAAVAARTCSRYLDDLADVDSPLFVRLLGSAAAHDADRPPPRASPRPTLIIAGERDTFTPVRLSVTMHDAIPGSELLVLPGGTHVGAARAAGACATAHRDVPGPSAAPPRSDRTGAGGHPVSRTVLGRRRRAGLRSWPSLPPSPRAPSSWRPTTRPTAGARSSRPTSRSTTTRGEEALAQRVVQRGGAGPRSGWRPSSATRRPADPRWSSPTTRTRPTARPRRCRATPSGSTRCRPSSDSELDDARDWLDPARRARVRPRPPPRQHRRLPGPGERRLRQGAHPQRLLAPLDHRGAGGGARGDRRTATGRNASALFEMYQPGHGDRAARAPLAARRRPTSRSAGRAAASPTCWAAASWPSWRGAAAGRGDARLPRRPGLAGLALGARLGQAERWFGADLADLWERVHGRRSRRGTPPSSPRCAGARSPRPHRLTRRGGDLARPRFEAGRHPRSTSTTAATSGAACAGWTATGATSAWSLPVDLRGLFALAPGGAGGGGQGAGLGRVPALRGPLGGGPRHGPGAAAHRRRAGHRARRSRRTAGRWSTWPGPAAASWRCGAGRSTAGRPRRCSRCPASSSTSRPSRPTGAAIALSVQEGGRRDLVLLRDGVLTRLTDDDALDLQPAWTPDGRSLLFASDRGGVYNLHAWSGQPAASARSPTPRPAPSTRRSRPTARPSPTSSSARDGHDVATLPFDPATWLEPLPAPAAPPPAPALEGPALASRPYRPTERALPTFWLPIASAPTPPAPSSAP